MDGVKPQLLDGWTAADESSQHSKLTGVVPSTGRWGC